MKKKPLKNYQLPDSLKEIHGFGGGDDDDSSSDPSCGCSSSENGTAGIDCAPGGSTQNGGCIIVSDGDSCICGLGVSSSNYV